MLTLDPEIGDLDPGDVLVDGTTVRRVGRNLTDHADVVLDARGMIVVPGFVDSHRHMWEGALRMLAADASLAEYFAYVRGVVGPRLGPDDVFAGTLLSALAALDAGITTVHDTSNGQNGRAHADASIDALQEAGVRAVFGYGPPADPAAPAATPEWLDNARRIRARLPGDDGPVTMRILADAADDAALQRMAALGAELAVPLSLHTTGTRAYRPVQRYAALGVLRPGNLYIHTNNLDSEDFARIRDSGGSVSVAPAIEMGMGHGYPAVVPALAAGLLPGLSTDVEVAASGDLFAPMHAAFWSARHALHHGALAGERPQIAFGVRETLLAATLWSAAALGFGERLGSITPGKEADLVLLRTDRPGLSPVLDPYAAVVLGAGAADVDTVLVAGVIRKRRGRLTHPDLDAVRRRAAESLRRQGLLPAGR